MPPVASINDRSRVDLTGPSQSLSSQQAMGLSLALYALLSDRGGAPVFDSARSQPKHPKR